MKKLFLRLLVPLLFITVAGLIIYSLPQPFEKQQSLAEEPAAKETVTIWGWDPAIPKSFDHYKKIAPDVEMKFVEIDFTEYIYRLKVSLATFKDIPDICMLEKEFRADLLALNIWDQLDEPPYNLQKQTIPDYILPTISLDNGHIVAIPYDIAFAGFAYRKSLAEKLLGSKYSIEESFPNWEETIEKTRILKKRHPDFYLFASADDIAAIFFNQTHDPFIKNGELVDPIRFLNSFKIIERLRDLNAIDLLDNWSPSWHDAFQKDNYLFYPCANWTIQHRLFTDKNQNGESDWGLAIPPGGSFLWGGTAWAIPSHSQHKKAAFEYIKWFAASMDGALYNKNDLSGIYTHYKPAYDDPSFTSMYHEDFGSLDVGKFFFTKLFPNMHCRNIGIHDQDLNILYTAICNAMVQNPQMTAQQAYDELLKRIKSSFSDVVIHN